MDQQQTNQTNAMPMERPAVMERLSITQLSELESQFAQGNREVFNTNAASFGWPREEADRVWNWFAATRRGATPS
jgi:hypothetical protein